MGSGSNQGKYFRDEKIWNSVIFQSKLTKKEQNYEKLQELFHNLFLKYYSVKSSYMVNTWHFYIMNRKHEDTMQIVQLFSEFNKYQTLARGGLLQLTERGKMESWSTTFPSSFNLPTASSLRICTNKSALLLFESSATSPGKIWVIFSVFNIQSFTNMKNNFIRYGCDN